MLGLGLLGIFSGINGFMGLFLMGRRKPLLGNRINRFWAFYLMGRRGSLYSGIAGFWVFFNESKGIFVTLELTDFGLFLNGSRLIVQLYSRIEGFRAFFLMGRGELVNC